MTSYTLPLMKGTISLLQYKTFEKLGNSNRFYLTVLTRGTSTNPITFPNSPLSEPLSQGPPDEIIDLLKEFANIVPKDLPSELPS